jgi:formylglycine-generating enzyme required for sulfatase activity/tetratricopeptide (TPR) repeat protein
MNDRGPQAVERFLRRFGAAAEDYRALACHAALPFVLTPELLHHLRVGFLRDRTPWVAEADLLLSDLCQEVGYEQYALRTEAREHLLDEMERRFGRPRMELVARRLLDWIGVAARGDGRFRARDLQSQQWGAMVYLAERRAQAVREMAESLGAARSFEARAALAPDVLRGEALWLSDVIRGLAREINPDYPALVRYAELTTEILTDLTGEAIARLRADAAFTGGATVAGIELAALERWLALAPVKPLRATVHASSSVRGEISVRSEILRLLDDIRMDPAIGELALAVRDAVRQGDSAGIAGSLGLLASALADDGQTEAAMACRERQLELAREFNLTREEIEAWLGLGDLHRRRGATLAAGQAYDAARTLANQTATGEWLAGVFARLAEAYCHFDRGAQDYTAVQCAERAIAESHDPSLTARMHQFIGSEVTRNLTLPLSPFSEREAEKADRAFNRALDLWRELGDRASVCATLVAYGRLLALTNQTESAIRALENAVQGFRQLDDAGGEADALDALGDLWAALGDRIAAHRFHQQAVDRYEQVSPPPQARIDALREKMGFVLAPFEFTTVTLDERGKEVDRRNRTARRFLEDLGEGVELAMVEIPGGTFLMGSPETEAERFDRESPQHEVTVSPFYIGQFTITLRQWRIVAGWPKVELEIKPDPSFFRGDDRPVENVNWNDAKEFCARLSAKTGRDYRLPTEAEWEYACRAGTTTPFAFGETITPEIVNYDGNYPYAKAKKGNYRQETVPVGSLGVANAFGLYDMHGNVWEWCEDAWFDNYKGAPTDGSARLSGGDSSLRVLRGGSRFNFARYCRSAFRSHIDARIINHDVGVRVVVSAVRSS